MEQKTGLKNTAVVCSWLSACVNVILVALILIAGVYFNEKLEYLRQELALTKSLVSHTEPENVSSDLFTYISALENSCHSKFYVVREKERKRQWEREGQWGREGWGGEGGGKEEERERGCEGGRDERGRMTGGWGNMGGDQEWGYGTVIAGSSFAPEIVWCDGEDRNTVYLSILSVCQHQYGSASIDYSTDIVPGKIHWGYDAIRQGKTTILILPVPTSRSRITKLNCFSFHIISILMTMLFYFSNPNAILQWNMWGWICSQQGSNWDTVTQPPQQLSC